MADPNEPHGTSEIMAYYPVAAPLPWWTGGTFRWATDNPPGTFGECACGAPCYDPDCRHECSEPFLEGGMMFQAQVFEPEDFEPVKTFQAEGTNRRGIYLSK